MPTKPCTDPPRKGKRVPARQVKKCPEVSSVLAWLESTHDHRIVAPPLPPPPPHFPSSYGRAPPLEVLERPTIYYSTFSKLCFHCFTPPLLACIIPQGAQSPAGTSAPVSTSSGCPCLDADLMHKVAWRGGQQAISPKRQAGIPRRRPRRARQSGHGLQILHLEEVDLAQSLQ